MTPQIDSSWKNEPCSEGFNTHLCGFQEIDGKNVHFSTKPRHVTPQILEMLRVHLWDSKMKALF